MKKILFWGIPAVILFVFITTNPGLKRFKEYVGYSDKTIEIKKIKNYFLFSVYEYDGERYTGVLLNFVKKETPIVPDEMFIPKEPPLDAGTIDSQVVSENPLYRTKDGQLVTWEQLKQSGYSPKRVKQGIYNGILLPLPYDSVKSNPKLSVWITLYKGSMDVVPYDSFAKKYNNRDAVNSLYYGLKADQLYSKTIEDFYKSYFTEVE